MMADTVLLVFARAPRLGQVKTRLIEALGAHGALRVHETLLARTLQQAAAFSGPARLLLDQADEALEHHAERLGLTVGLQRGEGLGERMSQALAESLNEWPRALLVGSDCPILDQDYLRLAATRLDTGRVVLGASEDGGFVLIGGNDARVWASGSLFERVRLGTGYALADTLVALNHEPGVSVLPPLWDVDLPEDVRRARVLGVLD
tara:strand:- start:44487 stop:45104 length:618 start_codon:yes stop_codon:yes gene_type:complete